MPHLVFCHDVYRGMSLMGSSETPAECFNEESKAVILMESFHWEVICL